MRILNAMFGRKKGGIEQAFIDYSKSLHDLGCNVTALAYQDAPIINSLPKEIEVRSITNFGQWDPLAVWKLKKIIKEINPDVIVTHGNRATTLLNKAINNIPVVTVCHNYNVKQMGDCKTLITVTEDLRKSIIKKGGDGDNIYTIPNMVYLPADLKLRNYVMHEPPVIGAMGRFVTKKGFNVYLRALSILRNRGVNFRAILGGAGTDLEKLKKLAENLAIMDIVSFPGWIEDKEEFFSSIDLFCVPSLHEPFGIVILEAFMHSVPIIATDTEGPMEIIKPHINGMIVEAGEADALADAMERLIKNPKAAERISKEGFETVTNIYDSKMVGKKLYQILEKVINTHKENMPAETESMMIE
ncbi:MAG: glycosyltransferase family 4 protein [Alphaproteobacteria bacterium]